MNPSPYHLEAAAVAHEVGDRLAVGGYQSLISLV